MLSMAVKAAVILSDPARLGFLLLGVMLGLVVGVIQGLGGLVGLSLLLPFTFNMDPFSTLAQMLGLASVTVTSDTIPAASPSSTSERCSSCAGFCCSYSVTKPGRVSEARRPPSGDSVRMTLPP